MTAINLTYAKAHLGELVDRAEAGESINITRRGVLVARLTAVSRPRRRVDASVLAALTSAMTPQSRSAAGPGWSMRDDDRY
ncbi:MAG: type II toxin-antitoxin system prevent-host-death family antitoxin [Hansschlegelia sp.]